MKYRLAFIFFAIIILYSCTQSKYAATNKVYKKQVKNYAKLLAEYPVKDSAGLSYAADWVGTTNLSMRRPNFIIIHHTAQNSCEQTLKTFTLPQTQVSAWFLGSGEKWQPKRYSERKSSMPSPTTPQRRASERPCATKAETCLTKQERGGSLALSSDRNMSMILRHFSFLI